MTEENKVLDPEVLNQIQPFSGPANMEEEAVATGNALQQVKASYTTAVTVQKPRSLSRVTNAVIEEAKLAKGSFYYGWKVKGGGRVEGPSIDLAMCLARNYGNCVLETNVKETTTHFIFQGVFIDLESGFTCPRMYRQRKSQSMGSKMDADRQEDIVFQIGQSKALRNAVIKAMPSWLISKAIEVSKEFERSSIVDLNSKRVNAIAAFKEKGVNQEQLEEYIERAADDWIADDLVDLNGVLTGMNEGRINAKELFGDGKKVDPQADKKEEAKDRAAGIVPEGQGPKTAKHGLPEDTNETSMLFDVLMKARGNFQDMVESQLDDIAALPVNERITLIEKWDEKITDKECPIK